MKNFLIPIALLVLVAACGRPANVERTEEEKTASRGGVNQEIYDRLRASAVTRYEQMTLEEVEAAETPDCRPLAAGPTKAECIASASARRSVTVAKRKAFREADPRGACVATRLLMGAGQEVAEARCDALKPVCQSKFAGDNRASAGRTASGLLGPRGSAFFSCSAGDQIEFAGEIFTGRRAADLYAGRTLMSHDPCHGSQIEYLDADGRSYLWYPGNQRVVAGRWEIITDNDDPRVSIKFSSDGEPGAQFCQKTDQATFNPATKQRGDQWTCTPLLFINRNKVASEVGDVFGLSERSDVPFDLSDGPPPQFREFIDPYPQSQCVAGRVRPSQ